LEVIYFTKGLIGTSIPLNQRCLLNEVIYKYLLNFSSVPIEVLSLANSMPDLRVIISTSRSRTERLNSFKNKRKRFLITNTNSYSSCSEGKASLHLPFTHTFSTLVFKVLRCHSNTTLPFSCPFCDYISSHVIFYFQKLLSNILI